MYVLGLFSLERYVFKSAGAGAGAGLGNCSAVLTLSGLSDPFRVSIFKDRAAPHTAPGTVPLLLTGVAPGTGTAPYPFSVHSGSSNDENRRSEYIHNLANDMR